VNFNTKKCLFPRTPFWATYSTECR